MWLLVPVRLPEGAAWGKASLQLLQQVPCTSRLLWGHAQLHFVSPLSCTLSNDRHVSSCKPFLRGQPARRQGAAGAPVSGIASTEDKQS